MERTKTISFLSICGMCLDVSQQQSQNHYNPFDHSYVTIYMHILPMCVFGISLFLVSPWNHADHDCHCRRCPACDIDHPDD